jgi:hypothetical protein
MDFKEFDRRLREITGEDTRVRPFICDGSPLTCELFVVGLNPATEVPFWPFWNPERGFDKDAWYAEYLRCRKNGAPSPTRRRTDAAVSTVRPVRCLETNLYPTASKQFADLPQALRSTQVFDFLVLAIKPRAMLVHGAETVRHVQPRCSGALSKDMPQDADFGYGSVTVIGGDHLTRFWKDSEIRSGLSRLAASVHGGPVT